MEGTFRDWLGSRVGETGGRVSRRELARRLAERAPGVSDPESYRSSLGRILAGKRVASQPTRDAIQDALQDWTAPSVDDEAANETVDRETVIAKVDEMIARQRHDLRNLRKFRQLFAGGLI